MDNRPFSQDNPGLRRKRRILRLVYLAFDMIGLILAGLAAMYLHLGSNWQVVDVGWYKTAFLFMSLTTLGLFYFYRLYELQYRSLLPQLPRVFQGLSLSLLLFFTLNYFLRPVSFSRMVTVYFWILACVLVGIGRILAHALVKRLYCRGVGVTTLLPVGEGKTFTTVVQHLRENRTLGYLVLDGGQGAEQMIAAATALARKGSIPGEGTDLDEIHEIFWQMLEQYQPDAVLLGVKDPYLLQVIVDYCESHYLEVFMVPDVLDLMSSPAEIGQINSVPIIRMKNNILEGAAGKMKRLVDICGSLTGLILLSPVFLILAILIKLDSPGPVFFRHRRLGMGGQYIQVYKFRTMVSNAEQVLEELFKKQPELREEFAREFKLKDDPRVTGLGNFLRKTSLDEFPQLINVLKGEMSLVGPRPIVPKELAKYGPYEKMLLRVPPGVTGMWQAGGRSDTSYEERIDLDMYYINNWSIWLDFVIILRTIPAVLARKGAY